MHSESLDLYSAFGNTIHSADTLKSAEAFQNKRIYCFSNVFSNYFFSNFSFNSKKSCRFEKIFSYNRK